MPRSRSSGCPISPDAPTATDLDRPSSLRGPSSCPGRRARGNACPSTNCTSSPSSASGTSGSHPSPRARNAPSLGLPAPPTDPRPHDPVTVQATPSPGRLEAGCAPECEPALEVLLHRELVGEGVAELDLEEAVAGLRAAGSKGVEGALLVEIDEPDVAAGGVVERHQRAQQPGRE